MKNVNGGSCPLSLFTFVKPFHFLPFFCLLCTAIDTITLTKSLRDGETLISPDQVFELGFFSPGDSKKRYLGIWYKNSPTAVAWVANRNNPIIDSHGVLTLSNSGGLFLFNQAGDVIWYANSSKEATPETPVAQLLDSGNFVVAGNSSLAVKRYLWQSFDHPTDTRLPGMKMGRQSENGIDNYLTSWKNPDDPSLGDFTYRIDYRVLPQLVIDKGSIRIYRSGPWNGMRFSGLPVFSSPSLPPTLVFSHGEFYNIYEPYRSTIHRRVVMDQSGLLLRYVLNERDDEWTLANRLPSDPCDYYGQCGANGICRDKSSPICECLEGFVPKSPKDWNELSWVNGCVRGVPLGCQNGDGFLRVEGVKLPDLLQFKINDTMNLKECEAECLKNCSCTAYANLNISGGGSGCLIWFGDLIDIREFIQEDSQQIIFIRMAASQLKSARISSMKKRLPRIIVLSVLPSMLLFATVMFAICRKRKKKGEIDCEEDLELPLLEMVSIAGATNNFSQENLIGAGGFGSVYKGILSGEDIAVKRLSKDSAQGLQEFKNEVKLIAKLQHRNLVRLLGCCIQGEERMLIYEYMPNKSLDYFIFDQNRRSLLKWQKRYEIAMGIARGLLYLHQDSRLTIIHRDLKASNILLDSDLNPKIADFGLARIFGREQSEVKTNRVIGTYGYMSPEYAIDGKFSTKSDVFSLGVLLLEIVSGKRNRGFCHPDHHHSLLGHAWMLWNEGKATELMDPCLKEAFIKTQVLRCINVGLLCVQKLPEDRPAMSSVVFMLGNQESVLPHPKQPGFFIERSSGFIDRNSCMEEYVEDAFTVTVLEAR